MHLLRLVPVWLVCGAAGGLYGWSALIAPLQDAFAVSTAQTGLVFSCALAAFTAAVLGAPYVPAVRDPGLRLALFGLVGASCLALACRSGTYGAFVLWFSGGFGASSGAIYITSLNIAARSDFRSVATPAMVAGFGIGGALFGPLWRRMAETGWGLDGLWLLAAGLAGTAACVLAFGAGPGTGAGQFRPAARAPLAEPIPGAILALVWSTFALGSFAGLMVLGLAAKMLDAAGAKAALSAAVLAGIAIGNTAGRLSVAGVNRALSPFAGLAISPGLAAAGLITALCAPGPGGVGLGLCLVAAGYGVMASAVPSVTQAVFGPDRFERAFALVFTAWGLAGFLAPWIAGATFDATGGFDRAILIGIAATASGAATAAALTATARRLGRESG